MKKKMMKKVSFLMVMILTGMSVQSMTAFAKEPEEAAAYVDMEGTAVADIDDIIMAEGVSVKPAELVMPDVQRYGLTAAGMTNLTPLSFQIDRSLGTVGSIRGRLDMTPALEYRLLLDFSGIQEVELGLRGNIELSDMQVACSVGGVLPVATIPYTFGDGMFTAYVTISLAYSASGEAYLDYAMEGYCGVCYDGETTDFQNDYRVQRLDYGMAGGFDVKTNIRMGLVAYGTYTLMDVEMNAGIAAEGRKENAELYFYLNGNYGQNSVLKQYGICGSKVIYDRNNSPLKYQVTF